MGQYTTGGITPIEIRCGKEGLWGVRNKNLVPLEAAITLRNATLEDHTWRTAGGATKLGVAIGGTPTIMAGFDWWPSGTTQRNVVRTSAGALLKDDGTGNSWTNLATGLTAGGNPKFVAGGQESGGRARKLFHCDGVNPVKVLAADGAGMATIASPPADWTGPNQPSWLVNHQGALWGGGNANDRHRLYKSLITDHEDFLGGTPYSYSLFPGDAEGTVAALSYKGGLLVWKYPSGVYFIDTSDPDSNNWGGKLVGAAGAAGPNSVVKLENDVLWVSPDGSWHLISATNATGSVRAEDITYRKLGTYAREQLNIGRMMYGHLVYYSQKLQVMFGCAAIGQTPKNRVLCMDLNSQQDAGERWLTGDRDVNESLWMRKDATGIITPVMGDDAGQVWLLDQQSRTKNGAGYTFEAFLTDNDFGAVVGGWAGRIKNLHYLQLEYDPRTQAQLTVEVWIDGRARQTLSFTLVSSGLVLPFTLPATFGAQTIQTSPLRSLVGRGTRIGLRMYSTSNLADVSISKIILGLSRGD